MSETIISTAFTARLLDRMEIAERTMAFWFEKPPDWTFRAGQFLDLALINPPEIDDEGISRSFSLASAPGEPRIMVATRLRDSAFKRVLRNLPLSSEVSMEGPFGDLVLHNNTARPAVFLSGGIGITPLRSILVRATRERLPHRLFLFYANRRPEDTPFLEELRVLEQENQNFKFIPTMTEMTKSKHPWEGETGRIDRDMMHRYLKDATSAIYYLVGPPGMVAGLRTMLNQMGIDDDDIRSEEFSGY